MGVTGRITKWKWNQVTEFWQLQLPTKNVSPRPWRLGVFQALKAYCHPRPSPNPTEPFSLRRSESWLKRDWLLPVISYRASVPPRVFFCPLGYLGHTWENSGVHMNPPDSGCGTKVGSGDPVLGIWFEFWPLGTGREWGGLGQRRGASLCFLHFSKGLCFGDPLES